jgi:hypothetical protein
VEIMTGKPATLVMQEYAEASMKVLNSEETDDDPDGLGLVRWYYVAAPTGYDREIHGQWWVVNVYDHDGYFFGTL